MTASGPALDGATILFGIVGDPIVQSTSPQSVTPLLQELGLNAVLVPLHLTADRFDAALRGLMALSNFRGTMVTYPHKAAALRLVDRVLPAGATVGAINAMRREADGSWTGDIFDGRGLVAGLRGEGVTLSGQRILLLGAGGAGSAIALALSGAEAASLHIFDVDRAKAASVAAKVSAAQPGFQVSAGEVEAGGYDIVINATPLGMSAGDPLPLDAAHLQPGMIVMDIVPKHDVPFLGAARGAGCRAVDFRAMAIGQYREIAAFFAGG